MNLLGYLDVLRSQRRLVVGGIAISLVLSMLALFRISPDGVSLRSPRVFVAKSTLLVTGGDTEGVGTSGSPDYLAQLYAQIAQSDAVRRLIDPTLERDLEYTVAPVTGDNGTPLPLISVSAFGSSQGNAIALANRVGNSLARYVETTQDTLPRAPRSTLRIIARPDRAEVFKGVRLTPSLMLLVLGISGTVFLAFTRHNVRLARGIDDQPETAEPAQVPSPVRQRENAPVRRARQDGRSGEPAAVKQLERVASAGERKKAPSRTLSGSE